MTPGCYECVHRGSVTGSVHSSCQHPATKSAHDDPAVGQFLNLAGMLGKRSGLTSVPTAAARELKIAGAVHGIVNGWFLWPVNFDPIWLERCDGFTAKAQAEASA